MEAAEEGQTRRRQGALALDLQRGHRRATSVHGVGEGGDRGIQATRSGAAGVALQQSLAVARFVVRHLQTRRSSQKLLYCILVTLPGGVLQTWRPARVWSPPPLPHLLAHHLV